MEKRKEDLYQISIKYLICRGYLEMGNLTKLIGINRYFKGIFWYGLCERVNVLKRLIIITWKIGLI